jgi:hypothetical protein
MVSMGKMWKKTNVDAKASWKITIQTLRNMWLNNTIYHRQIVMIIGAMKSFRLCPVLRLFINGTSHSGHVFTG